jgi:hypothetical protein
MRAISNPSVGIFLSVSRKHRPNQSRVGWASRPPVFASRENNLSKANAWTPSPTRERPIYPEDIAPVCCLRLQCRDEYHAGIQVTSLHSLL